MIFAGMKPHVKQMAIIRLLSKWLTINTLQVFIMFILLYPKRWLPQIGVGGTRTNVTLSEPKADLAITGLNNATGSHDVAH